MCCRCSAERLTWSSRRVGDSCATGCVAWHGLVSVDHTSLGPRTFVCNNTMRVTEKKSYALRSRGRWLGARVVCSRARDSRPHAQRTADGNRRRTQCTYVRRHARTHHHACTSVRVQMALRDDTLRNPIPRHRLQVSSSSSSFIYLFFFFSFFLLFFFFYRKYYYHYNTALPPCAYNTQYACIAIGVVVVIVCPWRRARNYLSYECDPETRSPGTPGPIGGHGGSAGRGGRKGDEWCRRSTNVYNARATKVSKNTITHVGGGGGGGGSITACGGRPSHGGFPVAPAAVLVGLRCARGVLRGGANLRARPGRELFYFHSPLHTRLSFAIVRFRIFSTTFPL